MPQGKSHTFLVSLLRKPRGYTLVILQECLRLVVKHLSLRSLTNKKLEFDSGQNEFVLTFTDPKITLLFSLYPLLKLGRPVSCKGYPIQDIIVQLCSYTIV